MKCVRGELIAQRKNRSVKHHEVMADCNSALEFIQYSRVAVWIFQSYCVIFTAARNELFSVRSELAR